MNTFWNINGIRSINSAKALRETVRAPETVYVKDFTPESAKQFSADMAKALDTEQTIVPVVIDSYGGQVYSLLSMIDTILASPAIVATIAKGKAMSCGSLLFACGTPGYRFMSHHATLMIHEVSSMAYGKVVEIKNDAAESERLNDILFEMLDNKAEKVPGYFKALVHNHGHADLFFTAEQARGHGLCDHIADPTWKVSVDVVRDFHF